MTLQMHRVLVSRFPVDRPSAMLVASVLILIFVLISLDLCVRR